LCLYNIVMTWSARPSKYDEPVQSAPPLSKDYVDAPLPPSRLRESGGHFPGIAYKLEHLFTANWHRRWERLGLFFTVMVVLAVVSASLFEIIPTFLIKSNVPTIAAVKPYTPLELRGRDVYISNGCYNCHSQMVRPLYAETKRYGDYSKPGEFIYDHPFQWGSRRIGPDLQRLHGRFPDSWHLEHMMYPRELVEQSIMPPYRFLADQVVDFDDIKNTVQAMATLGVPYGDEIENAPALARAQAQQIAAGLEETRLRLNGAYAEVGRPPLPNLEDKEIVALIAYLQRLGKDLAVGSVAASGGAPAEEGK
ncbi:MAG: cytochrome-c oxidase, cbb3-type subunit II, partial [Planctomycetota bacterium]